MNSDLTKLGDVDLAYIEGFVKYCADKQIDPEQFLATLVKTSAKKDKAKDKTKAKDADEPAPKSKTDKPKKVKKEEAAGASVISVTSSANPSRSHRAHSKSMGTCPPANSTWPMCTSTCLPRDRTRRDAARTNSV